MNYEKTNESDNIINDYIPNIRAGNLYCPYETCGNRFCNPTSNYKVYELDNRLFIAKCITCNGCWYICRICTNTTYPLCDIIAVKRHMTRMHHIRKKAPLKRKKRVPTIINAELACNQINKSITNGALSIIHQTVHFDSTVKQITESDINYPVVDSDNESMVMDNASMYNNNNINDNKINFNSFVNKCELSSGNYKYCNKNANDTYLNEVSTAFFA
jgi:hypothetical protein